MSPTKKVKIWESVAIQLCENNVAKIYSFWSTQVFVNHSNQVCTTFCFFKLKNWATLWLYNWTASRSLNFDIVFFFTISVCIFFSKYYIFTELNKCFKSFFCFFLVVNNVISWSYRKQNLHCWRYVDLKSERDFERRHFTGWSTKLGHYW